MSYLALYRKYRPSSFDDLVGQNYVSQIIKKEILNNQISHAYLFSGPRGTGKTSTAKIIAKMINCLNLGDDGTPCGKCVNCMNINNNNDVVEIDAASNNGVDEIRELRDKINLVPTTSKYKIYIIDEVHMLTIQAFNALLKTLEEPPAHVIFILATTELHKIPITVVSRCQKFQFVKFSMDDVVSRLSMISKNEKIKINEEALCEIARLSDGGLRDAINMLDQLSSYKSGTIEVEDVYNLNGILSYVDIYSLLINIHEQNTEFIIKFIENIDKNGNDVVRFLDDFLSFLKDVMLFINSSKVVNIVEKQNKIEEISNIYSFDQLYDIVFSVNDLLNKIKNSSCSTVLVTVFFLKLSISLFGDVRKKNDNEVIIKENVEVIDKVNSLKKNNYDDLKKEMIIKDDFELADDKRKLRINNAFATADKKYKDYINNNWSTVEDKVVSSKYGSIAGLLSDIEIAVVGDGYVIMVAKYDSLVRRLYNALTLIENLLYDAYDKKYKVVFLANDEWLYEKNKYIDNMKKGIKYNIMKDDEPDKKNKNESEDIAKVISLLGEDVIEYS